MKPSDTWKTWLKNEKEEVKRLKRIMKSTKRRIEIFKEEIDRLGKNGE